MIDRILQVNHIRLSKRERQLLDEEVKNLNTNNTLVKYVQQAIARQIGFEQSRRMMSEMGM